MFGDPMKGLKYGIMAGVSSFIFQLPLQLLFLECHAAEVAEREVNIHNSPQQVVRPLTKDGAEINRTVIIVEGTSVQNSDPEEETIVLRNWWSLLHADNISYSRLCFDICQRILKNPVLIGISLGFVLSLSTAGKYLRCPSNTCIPGLQWVGDTLGWLGECVSPISLFSMGLWIHSQQNLMLIPLHKLSLYMISKLIIIPLIMMGLAMGMNMSNEAGRAAILIASLPIAMASFSLAHQYSIGEKDMAANVTFGTILMLPAVIAWNLVLDKVGLFPIE
jgi:predicted permease